jgi:hypothetical protein
MAVPDSFFVVYLAVHLEDLPPGRPRVRDRHLKIHEDRDNLRWWRAELCAAISVRPCEVTPRARKLMATVDRGEVASNVC